jgi:beta-galactosidase
MKKIIGYFIGVLVTFQSPAQSTKTYEIDANVPDKKIYSGHLRLGGANPNGEKIAVNNFYLTIGGKPVIPITGEFHFSRYPQQYWDESIKKMKAGGITVIATYVFWNLHEEEEGRFEWTGDKNVRAFVELCRKNDVYAVVRIGPFCHGEIRNGGYPDWLLGKPLNIRSNDPLYLSYVNRLYDEIGQQLKGLYYKDGGPVIGIQIENEYQHSAAPWGLTYPGQPLDLTAAESDLKEIQEGVGTAKGDNPFAGLGNDHMKVLKSLAVKAGMDVPIYTATGWGYAATIPNESLPVTAAYAYPFWTPARDYSPFFLYKNMHANPDYSPVRYRPEDYPAFPAELGSGIMTVYSRRPIAVHQSLDALINRCLGSGANGIGYYMYHGGSTPKGKHSFMSDEAYGLPKISYDFQAPVGEYGQVREGFHRLKLLHFFIHDFGDLLAPMQTVLPENAGNLVPEDISHLRYAVRVKDNSGFLFLNNFQDDTTMQDQKNIQLKIKTGQGHVSIPEAGGFDLKSGENAIFPFNLNLNGVLLRYATAQLLMKANDAHSYYVFFTPEGIHGEFSFAAGTRAQNVSGTTIDVTSKRTLVKCTAEVNEFSVTAGGKKTTILVIDKRRALKAYVVNINGKRSLIFSDAVVLPTSNGFELLSDAQNSFGLDVYPKITVLPKTAIGNISKIAGNKTFSSCRVQLSPAEFPVNTKQITSGKIAVDLPRSLPAGVNDVYLTIDYTGDTGMGFLNGELVTDEFYHGIPWTIGLRKFFSPVPGSKEMVLYFRPMQKNASYLVDLHPHPQYIPDFGKSNSYLKVNSISFVPQYKTLITF